MALHQRRTRLATLHEVKGETREATMLVSASRRGDQSRWADWISDKELGNGKARLCRELSTQKTFGLGSEEIESLRANHASTAWL